MEKFNWKKWGYENNAPMALMKSGFNHAIIASLIIVFTSIFAETLKSPNLQNLLYFSVLNLLTTVVFFFLSIIPLTLFYGIHYKIFKKILLENKLEYSALIAWVILFVHFLMIYYSIDYFLIDLKIKISTLEYTYLSAAYIFGLIFGIKTFYGDFYKEKKIQVNEYDWKSELDKERKYF